MMLELGDDGTVTSVNEEELVYVDKKELEEFVDSYHQLEKENEKLKKELHLAHMRGMFSTVKSFKGDISKRYTYSEETDNVYDTANHYGQYHKILSKKEMVMLLNEYETVLKELKGDVE